MIRWLATGVLVFVASCASSPEWDAKRDTEGEREAIYEAAVRWLVSNYQPSRWTPEPSAVCLVVGWRFRTVQALSSRKDEYDPPSTLIRRLRDVDPPVLPISDCGWDEEVHEVVRTTGEKAMSLGIGYPSWVTANLAYVPVTFRETGLKRNSYRCSLTRGLEGWRVRKCV